MYTLLKKQQWLLKWCCIICSQHLYSHICMLVYVFSLFAHSIFIIDDDCLFAWVRDNLLCVLGLLCGICQCCVYATATACADLYGEMPLSICAHTHTHAIRYFIAVVRVINSFLRLSLRVNRELIDSVSSRAAGS